MSALAGLLLVSVSVGLSNFAGAIGIGLSGVDRRTRLRVGIAFGLFEAGMPLIGLILGQALAGRLGGLGRYVGAALLMATGAYTIWQGRSTQAKGERQIALDARALVLTAVALSIDNLVVGFALGVYRVSVVLAALTMGVVSVGMSLVGLELGSRLGERMEGRAEEAGGAVLILVGLALASGILH
ncbi:MAG TPA: manganese efflux pump [Candidatus Dormibacteraeota bacterium]